MKRVLVSIAMLFTACGANASEFKTFAPENDFKHYSWEESAGGITEKQFSDIVDSAVEIYAPIAEANNEELVYNKLWEDPTVNSNACRGCEDGKGIINAYGGLARDPLISMESYALVAAHELSHLYCWVYTDGSRKAVIFSNSDRMCSESNADTQGNGDIEPLIIKSLMKKGYTFDLGNDSFIDQKCSAVWSRDTLDYTLCVIRLNAGKELGALLAKLGRDKVPSYNKRDTLVVGRTKQSYPSTQCRLDNYFDGVFHLPYSKCWFFN